MLIKEEMETCLRYDATDDKWHAWSNIKKHITAMKNKGWIPEKETEEGTFFIEPSNAVRFASHEKRVRKPLTQEQKDNMTKGLRDYREAQKVS